MPHGRHDVVGVTGEDGETGAGLPVPYAEGLVVRGREDPWELVVKKDGANVVEVSVEGKETFLEFPVPYFNFVVVAARDKEGLGGMEVDASDRAFDDR